MQLVTKQMSASYVCNAVASKNELCSYGLGFSLKCLCSSDKSAWIGRGFTTISGRTNFSGSIVLIL